jgi:hypothetical protein
MVWAQTHPEQLLLKDYRPRSIYRVPQTTIDKARYPIIDMHSHAYAKSDAEVARWVEVMDEVGIEKTIVMTGLRLLSVQLSLASSRIRID